MSEKVHKWLDIGRSVCLTFKKLSRPCIFFLSVNKFYLGKMGFFNMVIFSLLLK